MRDKITTIKLRLYNQFVVYGVQGEHTQLAADLAACLQDLTKITEQLEALEADARYWQQIAMSGRQS